MRNAIPGSTGSLLKASRLPHRPPVSESVEVASLSQLLHRPEQKIPCGIVELDDYLDGGLTAGRVHSIHGCPASGKTTLALQFALRVPESGGSVVWLECGSMLNLERVSGLLGDDRSMNCDDFRLMTVSVTEQLLLVLDDIAEMDPPPTCLVLDDLHQCLGRSSTSTGAPLGGRFSQEVNRGRRERLTTSVWAKLHGIASGRRCMILCTHVLSTRSSQGRIFLCPDDHTLTKDVDTTFILFRSPHTAAEGVRTLRATRQSRAQGAGVAVCALDIETMGITIRQNGA